LGQRQRKSERVRDKRRERERNRQARKVAVGIWDMMQNDDGFE
jgi:hypothetical protein